MTARICKPSKTAMQSGRKSTVGHGKDWILEFPRQSAVRPDQLMGWQSSSDTARQVKMCFPDKQSAVDYAEAHNITYRLSEPTTRRIKPRAYADNFAFNRNGSWTH
jgi:hypothetical protein